MNCQYFTMYFETIYLKMLTAIFICKAICVGTTVENITSNQWTHHPCLIQSRQSWVLRRGRIHQSAFALPSKRTLSDGILGCQSGCIERPFTATKKPSAGCKNADNNAGITLISPSNKSKNTVLPVSGDNLSEKVPFGLVFCEGFAEHWWTERTIRSGR